MSDSTYNNTYTPDVLSCLANLSNDEVFTPPGIANAMLDMLPQELFLNPDTTFLNPACKSGVFLREIAKRLLVGAGTPVLRPAGAYQPHFPEAALLHRHHRTDQPAGTAQCLLFKIPELQILC